MTSRALVLAFYAVVVPAAVCVGVVRWVLKAIDQAASDVLLREENA